MSISRDVMAEYEAARSHRVWFDLSDRTKIELKGPDRAAFLHNFCTNDIKNLPAGRGCEAFLCNAKGKILAYIRVHAQPEALWIDAAPGLGAKIVQHLDRYLITEDVSIADQTQSRSHFVCVGHEAAPPGSGPGAPLVNLENRTAHFNTAEFLERRDDLLGLPCYHMLFTSDVLKLLEPAMDSATRADRECYEILRVEAGTPEYGQDIDETNYPQEVDRDARTLSFTKGCYLGQEPIVMIRDRGQVHRLLRGLKLHSSAPIAAGSKILSAGVEVGKVTSSVFSPRVGSAIALGYVRRGSHEPGTAVEVELADGTRVLAVVTKLPFV